MFGPFLFRALPEANKESPFSPSIKDERPLFSALISFVSSSCTELLRLAGYTAKEVSPGFKIAVYDN